nr:MAG TPA: hypothetical protein [Caudoviricetes sp.]
MTALLCDRLLPFLRNSNKLHSFSCEVLGCFRH